MLNPAEMFPNIDGMKRVLDEAQHLTQEVREIHLKIMQAKSPEEIASLEHQLKTVMDLSLIHI